MKLRSFSGLNTRISPIKIGAVQSTVCENVDYTADNLKPFKAISTIEESTEEGDVFYRFKDELYTEDNFNGQSPLFLENQRNLYKVVRNSPLGSGVLQRLVDDTWYVVGITGDASAVLTSLPPNPTSSLFPELPASTTEDVTAERQQSKANSINLTYSIPDGTTSPKMEDALTNYFSSLDLAADPRWIGETGTVYSDWLEPYEEYIEELAKKYNYDNNILTDYTFTVHELLGARVVDEVLMDFTLVSSIKETTYRFNDYVVLTQSPLTLGGAEGANPSFREDFVDTYSAIYRVNNLIDPNFTTTYPQARDTPVNTISGEDIEVTKNTYSYVVTLYSSLTGVESANILDITEQLSLFHWQRVLLDITTAVPTNSYFDMVYIYRLGNAATEYTKIAEVPISAIINFTDSDLTNAAYLDGKLYDTSASAEPPTNITQAIEIGGRIVLAAESTIYLNEAGRPDAFPIVNTVEFNNTVTAIAESASGVLVYLDIDKTYLVLLVSEGRFARRVFSGNQGCKTHLSVQFFKNHPIWISNEGVATVGTNGAHVISKDILGKLNLDCVASIVFDEKYYALLTDGTILICDFRFSSIDFYYMTGVTVNNKIDKFSAVTSFLVFDDTLYAVSNRKLVKMFGTSENTQYKYRTKEFDQNEVTDLKKHDLIEIYRRDIRYLEVEMFDDTSKTIFKNIYSNTQDRLLRINIPKHRQSMFAFSLQFTGESEIEEIMIGVQRSGKNDCC